MPVLALPAIGLVIAALMALLILYGASQLTRMIGNLVPNWHIPGLGSIRNAILGAARSALNAVASWMDHAAGPVANLLLLPFHLVNNLTAVILSALQSAYNTAVRLLHVAQHLYNLAVAYAARAAAGVLHQAQHLYNLAVAYAARVAAGVLHVAQHLYNLAVAYAASAAAVVLHQAQHLYNLAVSYAAAATAAVLHQAQYLYNLARSAAAAGEAAVLHEAQHLYNLAVSRVEARFAQAVKYADAVALSTATAAVGALTTDVGKVAHAEWVAITDDVKALEGVIATDLPDIGALVRAIPRAVPIDIAATIGGTLALERVMIRYLEKCGIPNCRNLSGLGRDLADLFKLIEGAGFLAFLVAMARDPDGTAGETVHVLDSLVTDTVGVARDLLGV